MDHLFATPHPDHQRHETRAKITSALSAGSYSPEHAPLGASDRERALPAMLRIPQAGKLLSERIARNMLNPQARHSAELSSWRMRAEQRMATTLSHFHPDERARLEGAMHTVHSAFTEHAAHDPQAASALLQHARGTNPDTDPHTFASALRDAHPGAARALCDALQRWWTDTTARRPEHAQDPERAPLAPALIEAIADNAQAQHALRPLRSAERYERLRDLMLARLYVENEHRRAAGPSLDSDLDPALHRALERNAGLRPPAEGQPHQPGAPVTMALIGTYPFNPEFATFDRPQHDHPPSNAATRAIVAHHALVIPVLYPREGELDNTPSAHLLRDAAKRGFGTEAEGDSAYARAQSLAKRLLVTLWDAEKGRALVVPAEPQAAAAKLYAALHEASSTGEDQARRLALAGGFAPDPSAAPVDPAHSDALQAARPGQPLFVVPPATLAKPPNAQSAERTYVAPWKDGPHCPHGVHQQALAIACAATLGGPRTLAVMVRQPQQGPLWHDVAGHAPGEADAPSRKAAISRPVHRTLIAVAAAQGPAARILLHPYHPDAPDQRIDTPYARDSRWIGQSTRTESPVAPERTAQRLRALWHHHHRSNEFSAPLAVPSHASAQALRGHPGEAQARATVRIAWLACPDAPHAQRECARALYSARFIGAQGRTHIELRIARGSRWTTDPGARDALARTLAQAFPVTGDRTPAHSATLSVVEEPVAEAHVALLGALDPRKPHHHPELRALGESARDTLPIVRLGHDALELPPKGKALLIASRAQRHHCLHLASRTAQSFLGNARNLLCHLEHARNDAKNAASSQGIMVLEGTLERPHEAVPVLDRDPDPACPALPSTAAAAAATTKGRALWNRFAERFASPAQRLRDTVLHDPAVAVIECYDRTRARTEQRLKGYRPRHDQLDAAPTRAASERTSRGENARARSHPTATHHER